MLQEDAYIVYSTNLLGTEMSGEKLIARDPSV